MSDPAEVATVTVAGRTEYLRIAGGGGGTPVLIVPPLFGEMNRCRRLIADVMLELAALGRGSAVPDLPGTGESMTPIDQATLDDWRGMIATCADSLRAATGLRPVTASWRGGAVIDDAAAAPVRWRMTPVDGSTVLRELGRAQRLTGAAGAGVQFAGTPLHPALAGPLAAAVAQGDGRRMRLADDPKAAEARVAGAALWRRAEPGRDRAMARAIAEDIDRVAAQCGHS